MHEDRSKSSKLNIKSKTKPNIFAVATLYFDKT